MHTAVYVIVPESTEDIVQEVTRLLEGSQSEPNKAFPTYEEPCSCIGEIARTDSFTEVDSTSRGKRNLVAIKKARKRDDQETEHRLLLERYRKVSELERAHPLYRKPDSDCDICDGRGVYTSDRDPRGNWDWWVIGGRWSGLFEKAESSIAVEEENLKGNVAYIHEILAQGAPAAIITPEGYWYSGPIVMSISRIFDSEIDEYEKLERENWDRLASELLHKYENDMVVLVDCHF